MIVELDRLAATDCLHADAKRLAFSIVRDDNEYTAFGPMLLLRCVLYFFHILKSEIVEQATSSHKLSNYEWS